MPYKDKQKQKEAQQQYYQNKKELYRSNLKENRKERTSFIQEIKKTKKCTVCGEDNYLCLDFHHLKNKEDTLSAAARNCWTHERILLEIEKCEVVCANCHRKKHGKNYDGKVSNCRKWLRQYKQKCTCTRCGENYPECLDFHHLKDKIAGIAKLAKQAGTTIFDLEEEIKKCIVLCVNCHRIKHGPVV